MLIGLGLGCSSGKYIIPTANLGGEAERVYTLDISGRVLGSNGEECKTGRVKEHSLS